MSRSSFGPELWRTNQPQEGQADCLSIPMRPSAPYAMSTSTFSTIWLRATPGYEAFSKTQGISGGLSTEATCRNYGPHDAFETMTRDARSCGRCEPDGRRSSDDRSKIVTIEERVKLVRSGRLTEEELLAELSSPSLIVRANAVLQLSLHPDLSPPTINALVTLASRRDPGPPVVGSVTLPNLAAAALCWVGSDRTTAAYEAVMEGLDEVRSADIRWLVENNRPAANPQPDPDSGGDSNSDDG